VPERNGDVKLQVPHQHVLGNKVHASHRGKSSSKRSSVVKGRAIPPPWNGMFLRARDAPIPSRACPFRFPYRTVRLGAGSRHLMVQCFFRRGFLLSRVCTINYRRASGPGGHTDTWCSLCPGPARLVCGALRHFAASHSLGCRFRILSF
jgi:hypothetical protein